ncbi:MAG: hypothetical protein BAJALOKI3v1_500003 [Promethearchaeota archaeon]|nr:MAG: hypothetical protein BAJALOKI3v1_500003 [Candidatus Lokiarchaeota archaeon]
MLYRLKDFLFKINKEEINNLKQVEPHDIGNGRIYVAFKRVLNNLLFCFYPF